MATSTITVRHGIKTLTMYLAGSIRDEHPEDIEWREKVITALAWHPVCILNPLAGKTYNPETKRWSVSGVESTAKLIVKHDFWCVDASDIVLFNFRALSQKYPNIGTLIEFGRATKNALVYSIVDPDYTGHENTAMYKLHPFIEENSAMVFATVDEAIAFLQSHLNVLSGADPNYRPAETTVGLNPLYRPGYPASFETT